ncbi:3,4-dehydroadipyl-CoA semialdehyde dehydrogenase [Nannocystis punicea]|uniref:3,4-dehydroadipyl-CoA semialdehyde dehydrogenase n=1 Tax=Nannocystis punicea TaxID=2995304 RepID=A0ABY7GRR3_9BACT|nr:3,4-dehydroadipyl-CoA semialdehyde dehydrogenase [Nannocystis poenicansa]WAS89654.1 3,4-dehydroadipyl-CoA semialdehyde dehydrogenase [Nannocystis poenicansa]
MRVIESFLNGAWQSADGPRTPLVNPATEEVLAEAASARGLGDAVRHAREVGGPALRAMSFRQRGALLQAIAKLLHAHREELLDLAVVSGGNTRGDAKFDVDGGLGVLAAYAELAESLPDSPWLVEGEPAVVVRTSKVRVQHLLQPRHGVAVHINAFNFPAWGMLGKAAVAWLAGMPVLSKPATSTSLLAHRIAELVLGAGILPPGAFQLLIGSVGDLLNHLGPQDVVAFTGSADTGAKIRGHLTVLTHGVRVNVEADSLNSVVLGPDVQEGSELWDLVVRDAVTELTQKTGQKCTATRRILVPEAALPALRDALEGRLGERAAQTGNPLSKNVKMGPLSTAQQLADARAGVAALRERARVVRGDPQRGEFVDVPAGKGFFLEPILLEADAAAVLERSAVFHRVEVFAPVATLLPYDGSVAQAAAIVGFGGGSLVTTVYSDDREYVGRAVAELGPQLGRLVLSDEKGAGGSFSPGGVFPQAQHGGPGRAGGGAELGGRLGLELYMQRTAVQGGASQLARLFGG